MLGEGAGEHAREVAADRRLLGDDERLAHGRPRVAVAPGGAQPDAACSASKPLRGSSDEQMSAALFLP